MTTFLSFTFSLMAKYLMLMCLLRLPLLLFLAIKTATELSQKILKGLEIVSTIFNPEMKLLSQTPYDVASKLETKSSFHDRSSSQSLLNTLPRNSSTSHHENVSSVDL